MHLLSLSHSFSHIISSSVNNTRWNYQFTQPATRYISIPVELRPTRLLLAHAAQVDGLATGQYELVLLVVDEGVEDVLVLLLLGLLVALYTRLVGVLATQTVRVDVAVLAARDAVDADHLLLERAVVVLEAPDYRAVGCLLAVASDHLWVRKKEF